ncbi:hypothetical protein [Sorangium sp. So ce131]|uniref:hypothetical protein n=1 Tax=Sorangium sp. So ce131 TaxID=3133282 RepID=UPI003F60D97A
MEGHEPRNNGPWSTAVLWVAFSPDGGVLASAGLDGSTVLFRVSDGAQLAALRAVKAKDAAYVLAAAHIDITGADRCAARKYPLCRFGPLSFPFELCEERFYVKDLLEKVQSGDTSYAEPEAAADPLPCGADHVAAK